MERKYVGWLLLDAFTGDTNRRMQETDDKMSFWCYIYIFLGRILYIYTISCFELYIAFLKMY